MSPHGQPQPSANTRRTYMRTTPPTASPSRPTRVTASPLGLASDMSTYNRRDVQAQPLLAHAECRPISPYFRFCPADLAAIIGAIAFILYIVWGINLTIRLYKYLRGSMTTWRRRRIVVPEDLERNFPCNSQHEANASSASTLCEIYCSNGPKYNETPSYPLDHKIKFALDQTRRTSLRFPDSHRSSSAPGDSVNLDSYSPPSTPGLLNFDESTFSSRSSLMTPPGLDDCDCDPDIAANSQILNSPPPAYMDHPFGRSKLVCKPCMS
ncbi:hypothetical protein BD311DRAFT_248813 [Dichomitus squalens]|uniref:Uncharacterized protein n=1 Tax=Dichomitus squalens TaxID=114155 RepID=A0A4Q9MUP2_9APHY|nr:hypothetical protein BD311DRAFT_248813 [Dichomitus squalens]